VTQTRVVTAVGGTDMLRVAATDGVSAERVERFRTQFPVPISSENHVTQELHERCIFRLVVGPTGYG